ncbi:MAG: Gfo/Idh/MocA family protein [Planctomycetota bacterium]|jgi:predicted dehydrogenase
MSRIDRRSFIEQAVAATAALTVVPSVTLARPRRRNRPNETIRIGVIGVRGRGGVHVRSWLRMEDVEVAAICDADRNVIGRSMDAVKEASGRWPAYYQDVRAMLDDPTIDAVSIATQNHWHTLAALWAVQAGKDAYVEKPISHNVWEGRQLVHAARKHGRIVAHGTQSRSKLAYRDAIEFLRSGQLGDIKVARGLCYKRRTSIGLKPDGDVPAGVDYDLWLGPAPSHAFNPNRFHYEWHWNWDYGNGDIGNQGVHQMDVLRWGLGRTTLPTTVASLGGRFGYEDDGQTPNTQVAIMDYGDVVAVFEVRGLETPGFDGATTIGNVFHCTEGVLVFGNAGCAAFTADGEEIRKFHGGDDMDHFVNFIEAVRARKAEQLSADALDGHLSSALCHLPNVSYRLGTPGSFAQDEPFGRFDAGNEAWERMREHLESNGVDLGATSCRIGRTLRFDPRAERFVGDGAEEANPMLTRAYREPFVVTAQG